MAKENVTLEYATGRGSAGNVRMLVRMATAEQRAAGMAWYSVAKEACEKLAADYGLPIETVTAVVAVMSPMRNWESNVRDAETVILAHAAGVPPTRDAHEWGKERARGFAGLGAGYAPLRKAYDILDGGSIAAALSGPKVTNFNLNLSGDLSVVTVDSHAMHAWLGNFEDSGDELAGSLQFADGLYDAASADYTTAADEEGIEPAQAQAIAWVVRKAIMAAAKAAAKAAREAEKAAAKAAKAAEKAALKAAKAAEKAAAKAAKAAAKAR